MNPSQEKSALTNVSLYDQFDTGMTELKNILSSIADLIPQGAPVIYLDYPVHENVGDQLIMLGTEQFFKDYGISVVFRASMHNFHRLPARYNRKDTVILCHGGGNFGDLYHVVQQFRERVVKAHPDNRIIFLPQTIHFSNPKNLENASIVLGRHRDLHIFVRDKTSYQIAVKNNFSKNVYLSPDMAHQLWPHYVNRSPSSTSGTLYLIRTDDEKKPLPEFITSALSGDSQSPSKDVKAVVGDWPDLLDEKDRFMVLFLVRAHRLNGYLGNIFPVHKFWLAFVNRLVERALKLYGPHSHIVTSRLHGHILACLMAKPSTVLDNSYGKNSTYYLDWTQRIPACALVETQEENETPFFQGLSIAFCTRNRPIELKRAVESVLRELNDIARVPVQILVVDDGELDNYYLNELQTQVAQAGAIFSYVNKQANPGLLRSRVETLKHVKYEVLLYLDDDAEVEPGYLMKLVETYQAHPEAVGMGGVDLLTEPPSRWRQWYEFCIGFRATKLGNLSISGYGGGADQWKYKSSEFKTDFLCGYNMSFRTSALQGLTALDWFNGYSLGEDLYLSYVARKHGPLYIQPAMKVCHYQSPVARDKMEQVSYTLIVNHYRLLRATNAPLYRYIGFGLTSLGLTFMFCVNAAISILRLKPNFAKVKGTLRGIYSVISNEHSKQNIKAPSP